jgi:hypothetical protein
VLDQPFRMKTEIRHDEALLEQFEFDTSDEPVVEQLELAPHIEWLDAPASASSQEEVQETLQTTPEALSRSVETVRGWIVLGAEMAVTLQKKAMTTWTGIKFERTAQPRVDPGHRGPL